MTKEKIISIIRENLETKCEVRPECSLTEDLGIDSFSMIMIIGDIEEEFSIRVDEDDFEGLKTVSDVCDKVAQKQTCLSSGNI